MPVQYSAELQRIKDLPVRGALQFFDGSLLAKPNGTMKLRPIQAQALHEAMGCQGLVAPIAVGGGKTLLSYLLPSVMGAKRTLLILPAALREKTKTEFLQLSYHWYGPKNLEIRSYDWLSNEDKGLQTLRPDLIIFDEAHKLKNRVAQRTSRLLKYVADTNAMVVLMSGTLLATSLQDVAHTMQAALGNRSPLPTHWPTLMEWCQAVDADIHQRIGSGRLRDLMTPEERASNTLEDVRRAVRRRVTDTPGVVATQGRDNVGSSLRIHVEKPPFSPTPEIRAAIAELQATWTTPSGEVISESAHFVQTLKRMAWGFYHYHDPAPPVHWKKARSHWAKVCRRVLQYSQTMDSEKHLVALIKSKLDANLAWDKTINLELTGPTSVMDAYQAWDAVRQDYKYQNPKAKWLSQPKLEKPKEPTLVWVHHRHLGGRLSNLWGVPYFGQEGKDLSGQRIEQYRGDVAIAGISANATGRNLQYQWSRNLVLEPPSSGSTWEQLLGRTHRQGQAADTVTCTIHIQHPLYGKSLEKALERARFISSDSQDQKLLYADWA